MNLWPACVSGSMLYKMSPIMGLIPNQKNNISNLIGYKMALDHMGDLIDHCEVHIFE